MSPPWWERCDPTAIGPAVVEAKWVRFEAVVERTLRFADAARAARADVAQHTDVTELRSA
ncbi:hypothetical protein GCM10017710_25860 [Arthrobacter ramosus]